MQVTTLNDSPLVRIYGVRCRPDHPDCGGEESSNGHHVVFPHAGVFVKHVRGRRVVADPSQVLFFTAGEPYRVSHPVPGGDDCTVFAFRDDVLLETIGTVDPGVQDRPHAPFARTHGLAGAGTLLPERALRHRLGNGKPNALEIEERALALLGDVARNTSPEAARQSGDALQPRARAATARLRGEWVEATKLLLAARPEANPTLANLARGVGCSPFHLARLFRQAQGIPIHQYQLRLRLVLALERLLDGSTSLLALALDLGFTSHSHFTAAFRRAFGITPSAFRRSATNRRLAEMRKNLTG